MQTTQDYEDGILNALFSFPEDHSHIFSRLQPEHFRNGFKQKVFKIVRGLHDQCKPDMVSNDAIISEINALITSHDNMDYSFWVQHLTSEAPLPADIDFYISRVLRNYNKRRLVEISNATTKRAQGGDTVDSVVSFTRNELDNLECENIGGGPVCFHDVAIDCIDNLQGGSCYEGIPTGYTDIDHYILGLRPSDLIIIAGRPSMGKTTLATNISINAAKSGSIGLIFSLEMSQNRLGLRMLASETGTNLYQLTKGIVADWEKINDVSGNLQNLFIDFSTGLTYQEIVSRIQEFNETHRLDFVMIDYLQKMRFGKADRHDLAVGEATGALKNIAKDLDIPVILLSQLSRANEKDGKVRTPRLSDLRDSGSIEQDADIVLMIHRPEVYSPDVEEYKNMAMVGIMKNRDGETTGIKLTFRKDINRFENYAKE